MSVAFHRETGWTGTTTLRKEFHTGWPSAGTAVGEGSGPFLSTRRGSADN